MYNIINNEITKGQSNDVPFLPIVSKNLSQYIAIPKATAILFGGNSGTGKTAIADSTFVLEPFDYLKDNNLDVNLRWIYRSMERPTKYKLGKWLCYKIYKDHGILLDVPTLYNWANKKFELTDELRDCFKTYEDYFNELKEYVTIIDGSSHPTGVFGDSKDFMNKRGKIEEVDEYNKIYIPDDPKEIVIQLTDHVGKIKSERDPKTGIRLNDKQTLDLHSSRSKDILRDFYEMVIVDISQLNRNNEDNLRQLKTELDIKPSDFKGSGNLYEDSDIVFGLLNPYKYKEFEFGGYDIKRFVTNRNYCRYRAMKILKNSYGPDDLMFDYNFIGESGVMRELPNPDNIKPFEYVMAQMAHHKKTLSSIDTFGLQRTDYLKYYEIYK